MQSVSCKGNIIAAVGSGNVMLSDVTCKGLDSVGDTGDLTMKNVLASSSVSISRTTGDVKLDRCDASQLSVKTDTGDVVGTLLSEKIFIANSSTGDVNVPQTAKGGKCEITTNTGDISISLQKMSDT